MTSLPSPTQAAPAARRLNPDDLRYLREQLAALRGARAPCLDAATSASDPAVRALAGKVGEMQLQGIRTLVALLRTEGLPEQDWPNRAPRDQQDAAAAVAVPGTALDLPFLELLADQAREAIVRARAEMTGGMDAGCRGQAEQTIRDSWRDLAVLTELVQRLLRPAVADPASAPTAPTVPTA